MTILQAYLNQPYVKRTLSGRFRANGFSLIELVVVVAVLAVLAAIAIPAFTSITGKARASAAANTVATIAKECAAKEANGTANPTFVAPSLDGYTSFNTGAVTATGGGAVATAGASTACATQATGGGFSAVSSATAEYPTFTYLVSGAKSCTASGTALQRGCSGAPGSW